MMNWIDRAKRALSSGLPFRARSRSQLDRSRPPLSFEPLEPRLTLAAAGLVPVGLQPTGPLTGKIVYTSGGHGWDWSDTLNRWATDRGDNNEIVEDFGNQEQLTYYADYLLRAGATVVPMRPIGRQINEVVLDNDLASVTYTGAWSNSTTGTRWYDEDYGAVADTVRYRFASTTSGEDTATATYTPHIPEAGFYPVYTWASAGTNRTSQLYKVNHTGGQTQIRVDHSMVGNGWVYLGTYHFNAGSSSANGSVQISNQGPAGKVVIADAIRFGNGMGDVPDGTGGIGTGSISGYPREDENSLHWLWRGIGLGVTPSSVLGTGNVSAPTNMALHMNQSTNPFGTSVYIGFHSNAGGGRGARGLIDADVSDRSPNQSSLALYTGRQINLDMQALDGVFEYDWDTGTTHTFTGQFGEIDLGTSAEMDATIIETAFHDSVEDAALMRNPRVRDQIARSTYEATLEYFNNFGGVAATTTMPSAPTNLRAISNASGEVTINWSAGPTGVYGNAATGFRIYASVDGYGFDGGTFVAGGGTTSATLTGYDPTLPYYFKVVAENAGGQSLASEVITALPSGGAKQVLIVSGFDRYDRSQNFRYSYAFTGDGLVDRAWSRYNNSFDYVAQAHAAIHAAEPGVHVASTSNEAVISGAVNLGDYDTVIWILGEESTINETFNSTEQTKVEQFIAGGGNLFVTGAEIGWDLDRPTGPSAADRSFYETTLKGNYVSDDAGTYTATPIAGGIFAGLANLTFSNGAQFSSLDSQTYNVDYPDVISPQAGAQAALNYVGGTGGNAAIQVAGASGRGSIVMFGFPFETITTAANRAAVMDRVFNFFGLTAIVPDNADFSGDGTVDAADYVIWRNHLDTVQPVGLNGDANHDGNVNVADYQIWQAQFGTSPSGAGAFVPKLVEGVSYSATAAVLDESPPVEDETPAQELVAESFTVASSTELAESSLVLQPAGALTGKIVYTSGGHGWQWSSSLNRYATDRPDYNEIVEDFGNQDQMSFYADYLLRAGATVVPMRPVGHQTNERVLDNDLPAVTYTGAWSNSASSVHYDEDYGAVADAVGYRFSSASATETATATYTPNIPQAGFYPVYTWVLDSSNRTNQLYRINAGGGVTEIRVDHRLVGKGWVYLGTYYFDAGAGGNVQISNQSTAGGVVIADAIRFGNGMGDFPHGPSPSGYPREDENSLLWLNRAIGQGNSASTVIGTSNVSAPSRMAEHMNAAPFGTSVYIGFHSNGTTGDPNTATARGAVGLIDSDQGTPNQSSLALYVGRQINQDLQALNGQFEHNWSDRTAHTYTSGFGEIDEGASAEMDMTIVEVGFHDNTQDSQLMRDPKVRDQLARSVYEATLEYFDNFGGLTNPASQPSAPKNIRAVSNSNGNITVSWQAGPTGVPGGTPTGFRIYFSRNGYGFYDYMEVAGAGATSYTIPAEQLDGNAYYFKVVAINTGGESPRSVVAGARKNAGGGTNPILVVDGFDRFDRTQNVRYPYAYAGDGLVDRVWPRSNNSFDYIAQVGEAIEAYVSPQGIALGFDFVQNEAVISGQVNLANYSAVVWLSGEETTSSSTFNATEQSKVEQFIAGGGHFFVSGAEIGWDLDQQNNGRTFYEGTLLSNYVADDANTYNVTALVGRIFAGISNFSFDNGAQYYNVDTPDVISPQAGALAALSYLGGAGGNAAIQVTGVSGRGNIVTLAFPFETITTSANRAAVMDRVLDFFNLTPPDNADFDGSGTVDAADYVVWRNNLGTSVPAGTLGDANYDGSVDTTDYTIWQAQFGTSPAASAASVMDDSSNTSAAFSTVALAPATAAAAAVKDSAIANLHWPSSTFSRSGARSVGTKPFAETGLNGRARLMALLLSESRPTSSETGGLEQDDLKTCREHAEPQDTASELSPPLKNWKIMGGGIPVKSRKFRFL